MNKNTKGAIAIGAATLLLLGGGGTLAVWNASSSVTGGTIYAGQLALASDGTSNWYHYDTGNGTDCAEYASATPLASGYTLVPGDDVIFCVDGLELTAQGGNLYFTIATSDSTLTVKDEGGNDVTVPGGLPTGVTVQAGITPDVPAAVDSFDPVTDVNYDYTNGTDTVADGDTVYHVQADDAVQTVPISAYVHVSLDQSLTGTTAQQYSFALGSNGSVDVEQVVQVAVTP